MVNGGVISSFSIQKLLDALEQMPAVSPPSIESQRGGVVSTAIPGQTSSLPENIDLLSAVQDPGLGRSTAASSYPMDTLVNFAAGWATFENGSYMCQNAVPEPERLNPDLFNINWEFDNFSADLATPF